MCLESKDIIPNLKISIMSSIIKRLTKDLSQLGTFRQLQENVSTNSGIAVIFRGRAMCSNKPTTIFRISPNTSALYSKFFNMENSRSVTKYKRTTLVVEFGNRRHNVESERLRYMFEKLNAPYDDEFVFALARELPPESISGYDSGMICSNCTLVPNKINRIKNKVKHISTKIKQCCIISRELISDYFTESIHVILQSNVVNGSKLTSYVMGQIWNVSELQSMSLLWTKKNPIQIRSMSNMLYSSNASQIGDMQYVKDPKENAKSNYDNIRMGIKEVYQGLDEL